MELDLREGWVDPELADEFPELGLTYVPVDAVPGQVGPRDQAAPAARWPTATPAAR